MRKPSPEDDLRLLEERMATTLYLAGESVADVPIPDLANHAEPLSTQDAPLMTDFDWLKDLIAMIRTTLAADPRRQELLRLLPQTLADGESLRILFGNLFPEQRGQRRMFREANGKTTLTLVQIEILKDAASGMSYKEIAVKRKCSYANVNNMMQNIFRRLNASSLQEAVAAGISMGYLPLDVMDFVTEASYCAPRDYSDMDCLISYTTGIPDVTTPELHQELAAFGLLLALVTGTALEPEVFATNPRSMNGVLCRLVQEAGGEWHTERLLGPETLRQPHRVAIGPPEAVREGFTPGNLFINHWLPLMNRLNWQEILEVTPEGRVVRTFCGGMTLKTCIRNTHGLTFAPSGALLAAGDKSLLRFTQNGARIEQFSDGCCMDVTTDRQGQTYVTSWSGRGDTLSVYSARGKLLHEIGPTSAGTHFVAVRVAADGSVFLLQADDNEAMMQVYHINGEHLRCWRLPEAACGAFVLDEKVKCLYVPCPAAHAIQTYSLDGTPGPRILLDDTIYPYGITQTHDGTLYLIGLTTIP